MFHVFYRYVVGIAFSILVVLPLTYPAQALEVYLFRGAGDLSFVNKNLHFSKGLERIAAAMKAEGIHAEVRRFEAVNDALQTIRKRRPENVAFIGHSMGALASINMARKMRDEGIRVSYIGLIDIPGPVATAGDNVEWAENFYSIHPVYGLLTNANSHPRAENIHVSGFIHNRMDDSPYVQKRLLNAVKQIHYAELQQKQINQQQFWGNEVNASTIYSPPQPQPEINAQGSYQNIDNNGIDKQATFSIENQHSKPRSEGLLSKAERFLGRLKDRTRFKNRDRFLNHDR